jgi:hypothetical protein
MTNTILIIENHLELENIEEQYPELTISPLILITGNFSPQQLESYKSRGYVWFDEKITEQVARDLTLDLHSLLWNWFIDSDGNDLSLIDGCSLGVTFVPSLEIMFNTILRYHAGLAKLLKSYHIVYHCSRSDDLFIDTIQQLQKKVDFELISVESNNVKEVVSFGRHGKKFDSSGRKRELKPLFRPSGWLGKLALVFIQYLQARSHEQKRVLFIPAGKHEAYFEQVRGNGYPQGFRWVLPLSGLRDLFLTGWHKPLFYRLSVTSARLNTEVEEVIRQLKENLLLKSMPIDIEVRMLVTALDRYTFPLFPNALNYYQNARRMLRYLRVDCVICSAEGYENFILAAQAAKREEIITVIIPHGLCSSGYAELKKGRHRIFDHYLSFGQVDADNYRLIGLDEERIRITNFPYFARFYPIKQNNGKKYRKALVLPLELDNRIPAEKIGSSFAYLKEICQLLDKLGIELIGIKGRNKFMFYNLGITEDTVMINGKRIQLMSGYNGFPESVSEADIIIGPAGTALIEAGLMGKDYYVFQHSPYHEFNPFVKQALYDVVKVSFSIDDLRDNILNRQTYKQGHSVNDFVDLRELNNKGELFHKFENEIMSLVN